MQDSLCCRMFWRESQDSLSRAVVVGSAQVVRSGYCSLQSETLWEKVLLKGCGSRLDGGVLSSVGRINCGVARLMWTRFLRLLLFGVCMV